ncbi:unnamed protein product [Camellia sinensis]
MFQWFLVSKVRVIGSGLDGYKDRLIKEDEPEEGIDSEEAVAKCAEIQNAISVGQNEDLYGKVLLCEIACFIRCCFGNWTGSNQNHRWKIC